VELNTESGWIKLIKKDGREIGWMCGEKQLKMRVEKLDEESEWTKIIKNNGWKKN